MSEKSRNCSCENLALNAALTRYMLILRDAVPPLMTSSAIIITMHRHLLRPQPKKVARSTCPFALTTLALST